MTFRSHYRIHVVIALDIRVNDVPLTFLLPHGVADSQMSDWRIEYCAVAVSNGVVWYQYLNLKH